MCLLLFGVGGLLCFWFVLSFARIWWCWNLLVWFWMFVCDCEFNLMLRYLFVFVLYVICNFMCLLFVSCWDGCLWLILLLWVWFGFLVFAWLERLVCNFSGVFSFLNYVWCLTYLLVVWCLLTCLGLWYVAVVWFVLDLILFV